MLHLTVLFALVLGSDESGVTLSGTVADTDGKPVAGATFVVAEGPPAQRSMVQRVPVAAPKAPDVLAVGTTDGSGRFAVSLPDESPEVAWRRTRLTLWAYHRDFALAVRLIDRDWPRASLPLTLALRAAASVRFKITSANDRPVADARITPLRVAGHSVPEMLAARLVADTGAEGRAALAGIVPEELETVRIESQANGVQWVGLPAQGRDQSVLFTLAPIGRLNGRLTADERRAVGDRKLRFATWQVPGDEHAGGGLAEVVSDDDGELDRKSVV
jgi:hypothetical protein